MTLTHSLFFEDMIIKYEKSEFVNNMVYIEIITDGKIIFWENLL